MSTTAENRYLITGAMGCIGAWVLHHLHERGQRAVTLDISEDRHRLDLLLSPEEQEEITFVKGDLTDTDQVIRTLQEHAITHVIHLGALQVPFCRANPVLGARVNVVGTVNIFEAARAAGINHLAYASSIGVYGPAEVYPPGALPNDAQPAPRTLYGVYKVANEGTANVYWHDYGISSTALRPYTIYGVARDQGLTSEPTTAMLAAAAGQPYEIGFGGTMQFQWASDVAQQFIDAAGQSLGGAHVFNLGAEPITVAALVEEIHAIRPGASISHVETKLPFPEAFDGSELAQHVSTVYETPLATGIRKTIEQFERCLESGLVQAPQ